MVKHHSMIALKAHSNQCHVPFILLIIVFTNFVPFHILNFPIPVFQNFKYDVVIKITGKINNTALQTNNAERPEFIEPGIDYTSLNKEKENPSSDKEKPIHKFPPIVKGSVRVFITACGKETNIPQFDYASVTYARCNIMDSKHCHEAPYMLDFLYNWYDNLTEETIVFSHAHLKSWHIDNIEDAIFSTQNTPYWKTHSFGGFANGLWKRCCDNIAFQDIYPYLFNGTTMPRVWDRFSTYPCCSTFFVKTNQIRMRPKENYRRIFLNLQKWVEMNPNLGWHCSRVFEYTWHILLGQKTQIDPPKGYKWLINKWAGPCPYSRTDII